MFVKSYFVQDKTIHEKGKKDDCVAPICQGGWIVLLQEKSLEMERQTMCPYIHRRLCDKI